MNIAPKSGPTVVLPTTAKGSSAAQEARARAVSILESRAAEAPNPPSTAQEHPVKNPTSLAPEEISLVSGKKVEQDQESSGQNDKVEAEQPQAEVKPPEEPISSQYAALARKEKALRAKAHAQAEQLRSQETQIKAREDALLAKEREYQSRYIDRSKLLENPLDTLGELGLSYDELTKHALNGTKSPEEVAQQKYLKTLEAKIAELEEGQKKAVKTYEEQQQNSYKQAVAQIRTNVTKLVAKDEAYETIRETGSINDVVELIESTYKDGLGDEYPKGTILDEDVAAKIVEEHLLEQLTRYASRISKIKNKLQPSPAALAPQKSLEAPKQPQAKTLTNTLGSSRQLSAKERAVLAFKGQLK